MNQDIMLLPCAVLCLFPLLIPPEAIDTDYKWPAAMDDQLDTLGQSFQNPIIIVMPDMKHAINRTLAIPDLFIKGAVSLGNSDTPNIFKAVLEFRAECVIGDPIGKLGKHFPRLFLDVLGQREIGILERRQNFDSPRLHESGYERGES